MTENDDRPELADGWEWRELADVGTWVGGGTPSKQRAEFWEGGTIPWVSPKDMKSWCLDSTQDAITEPAVEGSSAKVFDANSVAVVVRSGILEHTLPVALVPFKATANQDMRVVTPRDGIDAEWLMYALQADAEAVRRACHKDGTTVASIDVPKLTAWTLPVPPLDEQRRIVQRLSLLLMEISEGEELLDRATLLQEVFRSRALAEVLHVRNGGLPGTWLSKKLLEVADLSSGGTPSRSRPDYFGSGHLWVKIGDLTEGKVAAAGESITAAGLTNSSAELLPAGTVLLAMYGASIGRTGVLGVEASTNQAICAMRPRSTEITSEYLLLVLQANKETFVAAGYGGAQPNISQRYLKGFEIPVPPLEEQASIVRRVADMARAIAISEVALTQGKSQVDRLRRSALRSAASGDL
jgi:type I restriction enzyme S subunit